MSTTFSSTMGDRGRLVIPQELREHQGWVQGVPLVMIEDSHGVFVMTQEQARAVAKASFAGRDLVAELLADRREEAKRENKAPVVGHPLLGFPTTGATVKFG